MLHNASIFKKLLFNNIIITIIPLLLFLSSICYLMCIGYRQEQISLIQNEVKKYVYAIDTEKSNDIQKSEYVIKNNEIIQYLSVDYEDPYNLLDVSNKITSYMNIINDKPIDVIMIYTSNEHLYESKYINNIDRLKKISDINEESDFLNDNIVWGKDLYTDEQGKSYFSLYRKMFLNNNIIICIKVYIPEFKSNYSNITIEKDDPKFHNKNIYITEPVTDKYIAVANINTQKLIANYTKYIMIFVFIGLLFCIFLIYVATKINTKTTYNINEFINNLAENNILTTDIDLVSDYDDTFELKTIKNTINSLIIKIKNASKAQYKNELDKRRLALNLLQSKIDPHILYNSLTVISLKAFKNEDAETMDIIDNLVSYYRLVLANGKEFATIADELDMIRKYVLINEISHSKKYNLFVNIDSNLQDFKIPHLILQPFVENSIIHGLAGGRQNCVIKVDCLHENGYLIFKIFDNGYGMSETIQNELNDELNSTKSYGVKNSCEHIKLIYGDDCGISFRSEYDIYTEVTIKFLDSIPSECAISHVNEITC